MVRAEARRRGEFVSRKGRKGRKEVMHAAQPLTLPNFAPNAAAGLDEVGLWPGQTSLRPLRSLREPFTFPLCAFAPLREPN